MRMPGSSFHFGFLITLFCLTAIHGTLAQNPNFQSADRETVNPSLMSDGLTSIGAPGPNASSEARLPAKTGIREIIPQKYKARYEGWKNEFLATETGRREWELYENSESFTLTIMISDEDKHGAGTSKYMWDNDGKLIAATI